jgi:hypothetical protein
MPDEDRMHDVRDQKEEVQGHGRGGSDHSMRARTLSVVLLVALAIFVMLMYLLIR